jgi:thiol-disulfide isomerase/thioredoxin
MRNIVCMSLLFASGVASADLSAGQRASDFDLPGLEGARVHLASLRGKVVLVDFWASWCGPCREELPELEKLKATYAGKDVAIVTVNLDNERANALKMARQLKLTLPVGLDPEKTVASKYAPPTMPSSYVVDKAGVIRFVHEGFYGSKDVQKFKHEIDQLLAR